MTTLTERQIREKNYYAQYALKFDLNQHIDFSPVEGPLLDIERRPWNSYWRTYEIPVDYYRAQPESTPIHLLDFGCGPGDNALRFSRVGYSVTGFDICEENIQMCKQLFQMNDLQKQGTFLVSPAENLPFADEAFEMVVGIDILHHVDIPKAMEEVNRVLKNNGIAIFREPVEVPLFDKIRNTKIVRFFFPNKPSIDSHITEDEKKLNSWDLTTIQKYFPDITIERSLVLSRFDKFFRKHGDKTPSFLEKLDHFLIKTFPPLGQLGGAAVIIVRKRMWM